jgi:hypothetical protein
MRFFHLSLWAGMLLAGEAFPWGLGCESSLMDRERALRNLGSEQLELLLENRPAPTALGIRYYPGDPEILKIKPAAFASYAHWFDGLSPMEAMRGDYEILRMEGRDRAQVFKTIGRRMQLFVSVTKAMVYDDREGTSVRVGPYQIRHVMGGAGIKLCPWSDFGWGSGFETEVTDLISGRQLRVNEGTAHMATAHFVLERGADNPYAISLQDFLEYFSRDIPPELSR